MHFNKIKYGIRARLGINKMMILIDTFSQPASQPAIVVFSNYFPNVISYLISLIAALSVTITPSRCYHDQSKRA